MKFINLMERPPYHVYSFDDDGYVEFNGTFLTHPNIRGFRVNQLSFQRILRESSCSFCKKLFNLDDNGWGDSYCPSCYSDYKSGWRKR